MAAIVLATSILSAAPAAAAPEDVANDVSEQIMSPFCPGVTLQACPSDAAIDLRERIKTMAERGLGRAEIIAVLEREYGSSIRAAPLTSGSGLLAWLLPIVAGIAGVGIGWRFLRRWVRAPAGPDGSGGNIPVTPADRRRLDLELEKLRGET